MCRLFFLRHSLDRIDAQGNRNYHPDCGDNRLSGWRLGLHIHRGQNARPNEQHAGKERKHNIFDGCVQALEDVLIAGQLETYFCPALHHVVQRVIRKAGHPGNLFADVQRVLAGG